MTFRRAARRFTTFVAFAVILAACSSESDLSAAVDDVATTYLTPVYEEATTDLLALSDSLTVWCDDRSDEARDSARDAWFRAQTSWKHTQAAWFGPTTGDFHASHIGYETTHPNGIEETIASDATLDASYVRQSLPTTQQGLGAIEYVLFNGTPLDDRRCEYTDALAEALALETTALSDSWFVSFEGGNPYIDYFAGIGSSSYAPRDALGGQVGEIIDLVQLITLNHLGRELGVSSPEPTPGAFPEGEAHFGLGTLRAQIEAVAMAYGTSPAAISGAVASRSQDVDNQIRDELAEALSLVSEIIERQRGTSMAVAVAEDREALERIDRLLASLRTRFETDVVSLLDVMLGFSDADGDSG